MLYRCCSGWRSAPDCSLAQQRVRSNCVADTVLLLCLCGWPNYPVQPLVLKWSSTTLPKIPIDDIIDRERSRTAREKEDENRSPKDMVGPRDGVDDLNNQYHCE